MSLTYAHSYEDPETGETIDVMVPDDDDDDDDDESGHRNARPRKYWWDARARRWRWDPQPSQRPTVRRRRRRRRRPRPLPPAYGGGRPPVIERDPEGYPRGEYLAIRKSSIAEFIPAVGKVWASFLGTPQAPKAVGEDVTDRDNAAAHREALARHQQNQTRILALTELAARAVGMFMR